MYKYTVALQKINIIKLGQIKLSTLETTPTDQGQEGNDSQYKEKKRTGYRQHIHNVWNTSQ